MKANNELIQNSTVIFVDDNLISIAIYKEYLKNATFKTIFCQSSEEANEFLKSQQIDGIISDLLMPNMSGMELLGQARKFQKSCFKILVTGSTDFHSLVYLVNNVGIDKILLKPFNVNSADFQNLIIECILKNKANR